MAGHLGKQKRKRRRAEDKDEEEGGEGEVHAPLKRRRDGQQPTPPDSIGEGRSKSSRNLIGFDFTSIPFFPDSDHDVDDDDTNHVEAGLDVTFHAQLIPPPPSPPPSSASGSYDPELGARVCKRFAQIRQARERKYGLAIAAAFLPGRTPPLARQAEEMAQMELKRQFMEDNDITDDQTSRDDEDDDDDESTARSVATKGADTLSDLNGVVKLDLEVCNLSSVGKAGSTCT